MEQYGAAHCRNGASAVNVQNEPLFDIASNLNPICRTVAPTIVECGIGWPDPKWLQVDKNLPTVVFTDLSEKSTNYCSRLEVHRVIKNPDGTGMVITEQMRLLKMLQISIFASNKSDRDSIGWALKQHLVTNIRVPIFDHKQPTPQFTGDYLTFKLLGDHDNPRGSANFWQRDLTFEVGTRVLDGTPAWLVSQIDYTQTVLVHGPPLVVFPSAKHISFTQTSSTDSHGDSVDTITIT